MKLPKISLKKLLETDNIAELLDQSERNSVAESIKKGYEIDKKSMSDWLDLTNDALKLFRQTKEFKNFPFDGAANVKYPLITKAALETGARLFSEIISGDKIVKFKVVGKDLDFQKDHRITRLSKFMNYDLLFQQKTWTRETDKILHMSPLIGIAFRKTYYDAICQKVKSEFVPYNHMVINNSTVSLDQARRITQKVWKYKNDIVQGIRAGIYCDIDVNKLKTYYTVEVNSEIDHQSGTVDLMDDDPKMLLLEQHGFLDLDGDGLAEPYIILLHYDTNEILRIVRRYEEEDILFNKKKQIQEIYAEQYYTDYISLIASDGGYWPLGLAQILYPLTSSVNTLVNNLINAGTMSSQQNGFFNKSLRMKSGNYIFKLNEWKAVDILDGQPLAAHFYPCPVKEPSPTLFQLLGLMLEASKDLASLTDTLMGKGPTQNVPATTILTLEKQGLTVYNSMQRRLYWAFKDEFQKQFRLHKRYTAPSEYQNVIDEEAQVVQDANGRIVITDFIDSTCDVFPVFDPELSTERQRMAKIEILRQTPGIDQHELSKMVLDILEVDAAKLLPEPDPNTPPPPEVQKTMAETQYIQAQIQNELLKPQLETQKLQLMAQQTQVNMVDAQTRSKDADGRIAKAKSDIVISASKVDQQSTKVAHKQMMDEIKLTHTQEKDKAHTILQTAEVANKYAIDSAKLVIEANKVKADAE